MSPGQLTTPDGRYIVVRGRLWRRANPTLPEAERKRLVEALMEARRSVGAIRRNGGDEQSAHTAVQAAKLALGERGPVWWSDGAPDLTRHMARNTPYAAWFAEQKETRRTVGVQFDPSPALIARTATSLVLFSPVGLACVPGGVLKEVFPCVRH